VETAYRFLLGLAGWMLDGLNEDARSQARAELRRTIEAHRTDAGVTLGSATWLITAQARLLTGLLCCWQILCRRTGLLPSRHRRHCGRYDEQV
jgi:hypothetical protein